MSKRQWTPAQQDAITTKYLENGKSCNLLIGAAAGSGKTAVLVERVIKKLIPDDISKSIDLDKLLIVTFTNAAAREMEERINKALSKELEKAIISGDEQRQKIIKRQQLMLSVSDITTIDSFCLKFLRSHFNTAGIEPDFTIADSAQAQLLSDEAMEELFSSLYEENNEDFINLLCLYGTSRSDEGLAKLIRSIYGFICSIPKPIKWLYEKTEELKLENGITNAAWFKKGFESCKEEFCLALLSAKKGLYYMCDDAQIDSFVDLNPPESGIPVYDEWKHYYNAFYHDYIFLRSLLTADFDAAKNALSSFKAERLTKVKSKDEEELEYLKAIRKKTKDLIASASKFTGQNLEEITLESREKLYPVALSVTRLVEQYHLRFMEKKNKKNVLEFHDIEQLTADLLSDNPEIAGELQSKYEEILMDEYQDTSLLQEEIFRHITDGRNLFMVGDMKQSIYRFRSSDPTIFKSKSDTYLDIEGAENRKIILSKNFRSRSEVLESINDIFEAIMTEAAGELNYDTDQRLYCGNTSYEQINESYISECCVIETQPSDAEPDEELSKQEIEARFVASEINRLKTEHFKVRDGDTYRDIENRDIVILMSSFKSEADAYTAELNRSGIECFVESKGYFEKNEIRVMTALFKAINNPYCDIPLIGTLRSPIAGFSDDELVIIRKCKKGRFYSALKELIRLNSEGLLTEQEEVITAEKASRFRDNLIRWRRYSRYMSADRLVWTLYEETDFYAFVGALHGGEEAQANLRLLFERAKQYESGGFQGLFNFIKYLEHIKKKNTDLSTAKLVGEGHNVVRIMTIHKSKGLEFPVVFICGGGKQFNKKNDESRIMLHKDYGIAMDYIDFENSYSVPTPSKFVFKAVHSSELMSEEIRKLYVAATRAKEKLYFVATVSGNTSSSGRPKLELEKEKWESFIKDSKPDFTPSDVLSASGFADWVVPVAMTSPNWKVRFVRHFEVSEQAAMCEQTIDEAPEQEINIEHILDFKYPYSEISSLPTKVSVSELKASRETILRPMPQFMQEKKTDGAYYGTAMHKVMENLIPKAEMDSGYVKALIDELVSTGKMTDTEATLINPEKIYKFYQSELGKRIISADKVYREQPFEVQVPVRYIYPEIENAEDEIIILQGVIDCYFEENGELVLVDYKTDYYKDVSEIHEKYDKQLELYSYALSTITKNNVKEKFFYLFFDDNVV